MSPRSFWCLSLAALVAAVGCGSTPKHVAAPEVLAPTGAPAALPSASAARADVAAPTSGSIRISDDIVRACGDLPLVRFAFDSATLEPAAERGFGALARCFTSGPLAGRSMRLVGHADPRGGEEYNLALGQRRAGSAARYLEEMGMTTAHLQTTSRGAIDASGTDEEGWARDRRVDISLAN